MFPMDRSDDTAVTGLKRGRHSKEEDGEVVGHLKAPRD